MKIGMQNHISGSMESGQAQEHIDKPVGTALIRVSSDRFEIDKNDREIYVEKR